MGSLVLHLASHLIDADRRSLFFSALGLHSWIHPSGMYVAAAGTCWKLDR